MWIISSVTFCNKPFFPLVKPKYSVFHFNFPNFPCTICIVLIYAILFVFSGNNKTFAICKNKCAPKIETSLAEWLTSNESLGDQRLLWWCLVHVNPCAPSDCCPWNVASLWTRTLIRTDCFEVRRVIIWLTEWGHSVFQVVEGI